MSRNKRGGINMHQHGLSLHRSIDVCLKRELSFLSVPLNLASSDTENLLLVLCSLLAV